jgi:hypothetical protein
MLAILTLALTGGIWMGLHRWLRSLPRIPEQRGIKDDLKEATLQGAVRMSTLFVASILVRQLAKSRQ